MNILAVDTSTNVCGVAVLSSDGCRAQAMIISRRTHAGHLLPLIDDTLTGCGAALADMDGFAVTRGPGSFTGLRIGISTVKGLSAACDRPLAGISSLEALAFPFATSFFLICALLDAGKGQVYACRYKPVGGRLEALTREEALSPEAAVAGIDGPCLFAGSGAVAYRKVIVDLVGEQALFAPPLQNDIRPEAVAYLGLQRLAADDTDDTTTFAPVYIRKADAVLKQYSPSVQ